mgnify:FL=1
MMITNLLLAILIGFKIMEYISVRIDKERGMILSKKDKTPPPTNDDALKETISGVLEEIGASTRELNKLRDELYAHKVFTTKSLSELTKPIETKNMGTKLRYQETGNKTFNKLQKSLSGSKYKFTPFQIDKEVFIYLRKKGMIGTFSNYPQIKTIKDINEVATKELSNQGYWKKQRKLAYHRLWARHNYKLKKKANGSKTKE